MRKLLVLGAGTAGTMLVNQLRRRLHPLLWHITVVDESQQHVYQPGLLLVPFGQLPSDKLIEPRRRFIPAGVDLVYGQIDVVDPAARVVRLVNGRELGYDQLVIATGVQPRPDQTPGMLGPQWRKSIFDFYTVDGAVALAKALKRFDHGRIVVHVTEMPIKCPVAPLEFAFLADAYFREREMRDRVELVFATPLSTAFTKPVAAQELAELLDERKIRLEPDFVVQRIDPRAKTLVSFDEREVRFDLLVTVPVNMGGDYLARSGLGNELNCVPVDKHTFLAVGHDNIFALGDVADLPTSKAGSVAHYSVEVFVDNFLRHVAGVPTYERFDGHADCFVETGRGKAVLLDFDYHTQPLPGHFPLPAVGPFSLLRESRFNHWGKHAFRWVYWNLLLPGRLPHRRKLFHPHGSEERHDDLGNEADRHRL
jgi:sulfide:quinone oxidoreductase